MRLHAIHWFGGKGRMLRHLLPLMEDIPHDRYIEVFGGGCSILLNKPIKSFECYNDIDQGLYNFFTVISDPDMFDRFYRRVGLLPYCRQLFIDCKGGWETEEDPIKRAAMWYVVSRQSFGGDFSSGGWSSATKKVSNGMAITNGAWISALKKLPLIHERLQRVQIENRDFRDILSRYDDPDTLFYLDPPYVDHTRSHGKYTHEMDNQDHKDMIEILHTIKGKAIVSGYDNKIYDPLNKWNKIKFNTSCSAASKRKRNEYVWTNI